MNSPNLSAFINGRGEIWLWPAAVAAYYATTTDSLLTIFLLILSIFTGSISYTFHENVRQIMDQVKEQHSRQNRRSHQNNSEEEEVFEDIFDNALDLFPTNLVAKLITVFGWIIEFILFTLFFLWLAHRIAVSYPPTITEVGLIFLPILSVAILISNILWNS